MSGYTGINLKDILQDNQLGESVAKDILSSFLCPLNPDVEHFLRHTAIEFSKQGISSTHLIMASYKGKYVLAGYFTLANSYNKLITGDELLKPAPDKVKLMQGHLLR